MSVTYWETKDIKCNKVKSRRFFVELNAYTSEAKAR